MKKIAIVSGKGGIGKTTLAINLGYLLNKYVRDTIIVDGNLTTPHLSVNLGIYNAKSTLNHILKDRSTIEEAVLEHPTGLKVIPASLEIEDLKDVDILKLPEKLEGTNLDIIVDSAPGIGREGIAAISSADEILFVTQPHINAVVDIFRCKKIAEEFNKKILGVVVNCRKGYKHELSNNEIEQLTETPVIENIPYDLEIEKSIAAKLPLDLYNHKARANKSFYSLASKISNLNIVNKNQGFFTKIKNLFKF